MPLDNTHNRAPQPHLAWSSPRRGVTWRNSDHSTASALHYVSRWVTLPSLYGNIQVLSFESHLKKKNGTARVNTLNRRLNLKDDLKKTSFLQLDTGKKWKQNWINSISLCLAEFLPLLPSPAAMLSAIHSHNPTWKETNRLMTFSVSLLWMKCTFIFA